MPYDTPEDLDRLCDRIKSGGDGVGAVDVEYRDVEYRDVNVPPAVVQPEPKNPFPDAPLRIRPRIFAHETVTYATGASIVLGFLKHFYSDLLPYAALLLTGLLFVWFFTGLKRCAKAIDRVWHVPVNEVSGVMQRAIEMQIMQSQIAIALAVGLAIASFVK